jgi:hypothetical protein
VAERVDRRGALIRAQLSRVPTPAWFGLLIAGGVLAAALVQLVGTGGGSGVTSELVSLPRGANASSFPVTYQVSTPAHTAVRCEVDAVGADHAVVGTVMDTVPARTDASRTTVRTIVVATTKRAVSADVDTCTVVRTR